MASQPLGVPNPSSVGCKERSYCGKEGCCEASHCFLHCHSAVFAMCDVCEGWMQASCPGFVCRFWEVGSLREAGGEDFLEVWYVGVEGVFFEFADRTVECWMAPGAAWSGLVVETGQMWQDLEPLRRDLAAELACDVGLNMVFEALSGGPVAGLPAVV